MKKALSEEEWARKSKAGHSDRGFWQAVSIQSDGRVATSDTEGFAASGDMRHALAALCLHGQPFGFTQYDVNCLRVVATYSRTIGDAFLHHPDGSSRANKLDDLADRIEALLPPKAPT